MDNLANPRLIKFRIKQSKTNPFRQGTDLYLSITDNSICPIAGLIPYLTIRGAQPGTLFMTSNHRYFTRALYSQRLNELLSLLQVDTRQYNTHNFQIGAVTTAALAHISDAHIKMFGRWRSEAYTFTHSLITSFVNMYRLFIVTMIVFYHVKCFT